MAEKRMISKVISISKKFNIRLNDHFSRLLYVLLIPHSDDFGRLTGDPFKIKALILPMMNDVTEDDVQMSLGKLHKAELIVWYESVDEKYIQINNFDTHQTGLHKRTKSKFPDPPVHSGKFPEIPSEQNRTEGNRTEENRTEQNGTYGVPVFDNPHNTKIQNWLKQYNVRVRGVSELEEMFSYVGTMDIEVIEHCIKKAENQHVPYCKSILDRLLREGKTSKQSIQPSFQLITTEPKTDPEIEARRREIELNRWVNAGNDPSEFVYKPAASH